MDKNKKMYAVLSVLFVVAVLVWLDVLRDSPQQETTPPIAVEFESLLEDEEFMTLIKARSQLSERKDTDFTGWGRTPFYQPSMPHAPVEKDTPILEGIFWDDEDPYAIINGAVVRKGERIGEYRIIDISKDLVTVRDGQKQFQLKIEFY